MHNIETIVCELIQAPSVAHHGFKSRHFHRDGGGGPIDRANAHSGPIQSLSVAGPIFRRSAQIQNSTRWLLLKRFRNDFSKKLESTLAKSVIEPIGTKAFARIDHGLLRSPDRVSHTRSSIVFYHFLLPFTSAMRGGAHGLASGARPAYRLTQVPSSGGMSLQYFWRATRFAGQRNLFTDREVPHWIGHTVCVIFEFRRTSRLSS